MEKVEDIGARSLVAVTPSDTTVFANPCRALWIGVTGNVAVMPEYGSSPVTISNVPVGVLPVRAIQVMNTNTTASGIVAFF